MKRYFRTLTYFSIVFLFAVRSMAQDTPILVDFNGATAEENGVYNVGSGQARSFNDLIAVLNDALGTSLEPDYFDCPYSFFQPFTEANADHSDLHIERGHELMEYFLKP